jgi:hypothetical protein
MIARPKAGEPPQLDAPLDVLRELLAVERARLTIALAIEAKRSIVFPETTVIVRDIERLLAEIERREAPAATPASGPVACELTPVEFEPWEGE